MLVVVSGIPTLYFSFCSFEKLLSGAPRKAGDLVDSKRGDLILLAIIPGGSKRPDSRLQATATASAHVNYTSVF